VSQITNDLDTLKVIYPFEITKRYGSKDNPDAVEIKRPSGYYLFCGVDENNGIFTPDPRALHWAKGKLIFCYKGIFYLAPKYPSLKLNELKRLNPPLMSEKMAGLKDAIMKEFDGEVI